MIYAPRVATIAAIVATMQDEVARKITPRELAVFSPDSHAALTRGIGVRLFAPFCEAPSSHKIRGPGSPAECTRRP